jgi:putative FmdB family regulatory protein
MPIYAYRCAACGHAKDVLQKLSDAPLTDCPSCGAPRFEKQVTAAGFQLKGSGWYVTDFREGANKKADKAADKAADKTADNSAETGADKKTDAKPAADGAKPTPAAAPAPAPAPAAAAPASPAPPPSGSSSS